MKNARNAMIAEVVFAFLRDRMAAQLPGVQPRRKSHRNRNLLIGGGVVAGLGLLLFGRGKIRALLPGGASTPEPPPMPPNFDPVPETGPSNYDAPGPVTNTATAVPVPPAYESPAIDEAEEEAAAAAEAANIGGPVTDYSAPGLHDPIAPPDVPLAESGEGEAEGQEQAEAELEAAAEPADGESPEQRQIEDAIDAAENPAVGEKPEPAAPDQWQTWSGRSIKP